MPFPALLVVCRKALEMKYCYQAKPCFPNGFARFRGKSLKHHLEKPIRNKLPFPEGKHAASFGAPLSLHFWVQAPADGFMRVVGSAQRAFISAAAFKQKEQSLSFLPEQLEKAYRWFVSTQLHDRRKRPFILMLLHLARVFPSFILLL